MIKITRRLQKIGKKETIAYTVHNNYLQKKNKCNHSNSVR